jgi:hypothetical protein
VPEHGHGIEHQLSLRRQPVAAGAQLLLEIHVASLGGPRRPLPFAM